MRPQPGPLPQPHLRPLRRPDGSVQIGVGPGSARLIGLTAGEYRWLGALDTGVTLTAALSCAAVEGVDPARATDILDRLVTRGLLHPVPAQEPPRIAVVGSGALPALVVDVLRQGEQVSTTRVRPGGEGEVPADLAVVTSTAPATAETVLPWLGAGTPVLPVWCQYEHASIGPLLTPHGRPCLHCLDLTRIGVDPAWPWLRAQLARPGLARPAPVDGLPAVRLLAAGLVTALVLDHVAGRLLTPQWSFEVATPGPTLERRRWPTHPHCPECAPSVTGVSTSRRRGCPASAQDGAAQ